MSAPILSKNKAARMEVAEIVEQFKAKNDQIRYRIRLYKSVYSAIPLINGAGPFNPGDRVIILFEDSRVDDTPFIIGKYNQKNYKDEKIISEFKKVESEKDDQAIRHENDNSYIELSSRKKQIIIANKDKISGKIIIDNDSVFIGDTNLTDFIESTNKIFSKKDNSLEIAVIKKIELKSGGQIYADSEQIDLFANKFTIDAKNTLNVHAVEHLNMSSAFFEFKTITSKVHDASHMNAVGFDIVDGNFALAIGKGNVNYKIISSKQSFNFFLSPLGPLYAADISVSGLTIDNKGFLFSNGMGSNKLILNNTKFEASIAKKVSSLTLDTVSFEASIPNAKIKLTPAEFIVEISGNTLKFSAKGLTIEKGNISADMGDIKAQAYSLKTHMHQSAIPGPPSAAIPGAPAP